ncbi:mechanosensitive ion channel family protein [Mucilaginibacter aquatilis]|uniref:Mechanosensitive ion channel n=1 Tax=Mucilaginibacter aquatilis TaxID=1517760 RepID=A0A6I4IQ12_9SPHI|nr:mechanosensitive ion channel family protein [Mucilaginibacter aquatilis]MVN90284.1 mechanosensitive ion channel [Mucilaginibacter aquatilis]
MYTLLIAQTEVVPSISDLYNNAYHWVIKSGPKVVIGIILFFIGLWLIRQLRKWMTRRMASKQIHSSLQPFFLSLTITGLHMVLVVVVMEIMGLELTIFTAILSAATVAAGLALSGTLQNFAGGVMILLLKPFDIGDNIIAQGQNGKVTSIQVFYTVVLTFDNKTVIIPNGKLFNEVITNVSREGKRRLDVDFKLGFVADHDLVVNIIKQAIAQTPGILSEPAPLASVWQIEFDGVKYTSRVWVQASEYTSAQMGLTKRIMDGLKSAGVKLPGT